MSTFIDISHQTGLKILNIITSTFLDTKYSCVIAVETVRCELVFLREQRKVAFWGTTFFFFIRLCVLRSVCFPEI